MCAVDDNRPARRNNSSSSGGGGGGVFIIAAAEGGVKRTGGQQQQRERGERERKKKKRIYRPSMAPQTTASCTGSTLLQPISEIINLPLDQVNFVACQLFALLMAVWFRLYLHPSKTSPFIRHVVATLLGFYLALFCFGWYSLHFLVQSGLSYSVMVFAGLEHMHKNPKSRQPCSIRRWIVLMLHLLFIYGVWLHLVVCISEAYKAGSR